MEPDPRPPVRAWDRPGTVSGSGLDNKKLTESKTGIVPSKATNTSSSAFAVGPYSGTDWGIKQIFPDNLSKESSAYQNKEEPRINERPANPPMPYF